MEIVILILVGIIFLKVTGFKVTVSDVGGSQPLRRSLCVLCDEGTELWIDPGHDPLVSGLCRRCGSLKPGDMYSYYGIGASTPGEIRRLTRIVPISKNHIKYFYEVLT